tara:strand:- start:35804 stop:35959 length:156 start_codon:yes stop_codon:yes gene_type:complete
MKMYIEFKCGRWLVNGKRMQDLNIDEKHFMDDFFREIKATREIFETLKIAN